MGGTCAQGQMHILVCPLVPLDNQRKGGQWATYNFTDLSDRTSVIQHVISKLYAQWLSLVNVFFSLVKTKTACCRSRVFVGAMKSSFGGCFYQKEINTNSVSPIGCPPGHSGVCGPTLAAGLAACHPPHPVSCHICAFTVSKKKKLYKA